MFAFDVIVCDPPWSFEAYSAAGNRKGPEAQYRTMADRDILSLPVGDLAAPDALLLLWATAPKLPLAVRCMQRWGFAYVSCMAWRKLTANGKLRWGTGYRARSCHENVLIGTVGRPRQAFAPPSLFDGEAREHSRKPDAFYEMAERMMPDAQRADLFSRQSREGWATFGDEATKFDVASLRPPNAEQVRMRWRNGMDTAEIATLLGMPEADVHAHIAEDRQSVLL